ncbi:MAG: prolyl oligopeptidase family serine peptidase [bacterium]
MRSSLVLLLIALVLLTPTLLAQTTKKPLDHNVYDGWNRIAGDVISKNGKWILYSVEPQEGDAHLVVYNTESCRYDTIPRATGARISEASDYAAFMIKPFFAEVKKMKIAKKKPDDMPKDTLGILHLATMKVTKIPRVKSFKTPEKGSGWLAYQLEKEPVDTTKKVKKTPEKKDGVSDAPEDEADKKEEKGTTVILRNLLTAKEYSFPFASEFVFSKNGSRLILTTTGNDSTLNSGVLTMSTTKAAAEPPQTIIDTLLSGKGKYKNVICDDEGNQAAFIAHKDTSKAKQKYYALYYWNTELKSAEKVVDTLTAGLPSKWLVNENARVYFSKDGKKLFLGTSPVLMPDDTTMNDEETAKLDIWNWKDPLLQPQQLKNLETEKKRSYLSVFQLKKKKFIQLASQELPTVSISKDGDAEIAIGTSDIKYRQLVSWDGSYNDIYLVDVNTGSTKKILEKLDGSASLSPNLEYLYWFTGTDSSWHCYSLSSGKMINLSARIPYAVHNELNDVPDTPSSYGLMGWTENDEDLFVYDRYDIWRLDPDGKRAAENITRSVGRQEQLRFRYVRLDPEERFLKPDVQILLSTFSYVSKSAGFSTMKLNGSQPPSRLLLDAYDFATPRKAEQVDRIILTRSTFKESPDLYLTDLSFKTFERLSTINPQQKEYLWGSVELISWMAADGKPLEGLLYKPENFDLKKKYPLISYFYERMSDGLHRYIAPAPSASTINISFFVSRGYIVFVPDIRYQVGYPGKSALDCIVPGILKLVAQGFIDSSKIGIQGQSWGGYQAAYMVANSKMFAAAGAGAPVSNMTSAYGGIRWESGMSRMFQYEKTQSRIGATLWEAPMLYIENSPIFRVPYINTPLLIMSNDADGAVPWYQGIEFFTALRRLQKPAWLLVYNGEAHNLVQRKNRKDLSIRLSQFFDHYLKGEPAPVWMTKGLPAIEKGKTRGYELDVK